MKRNWIIIIFMLLATVALWAQAASTPTPQADTKANGCACCNHDMKADASADKAKMSGCCGGKDAKACSRKDAKGCCDGMKDMKKDAGTQAMSCGKDCCKNGKCEMAKNGKKCCDNCPGMAEGK